MARTIVLCDDDETFLALLCDVLGAAGYRVVAETTAADVLPRVLHEHPALVILDFWLAGRADGLAVLRQLRDTPQTATLPVLLCSADREALRDYAADWRALGCDILVKPFALDVLLRRVEGLVRTGEGPRHDDDMGGEGVTHPR